MGGRPGLRVGIHAANPASDGLRPQPAAMSFYEFRALMGVAYRHTRSGLRRTEEVPSIAFQIEKDRYSTIGLRTGR
jgi:hypothetical protein